MDQAAVAQRFAAEKADRDRPRRIGARNEPLYGRFRDIEGHGLRLRAAEPAAVGIAIAAGQIAG